MEGCPWREGIFGRKISAPSWTGAVYTLGRDQMQTQVLFTAPGRSCLRLSVKPYCPRSRARKASFRTPIHASAAAVNPLLPLWQQHVVQQAALKAVGAAVVSFLAASGLSTLVGKVARKVRSDRQLCSLEATACFYAINKDCTVV